MNYPKKKKGEGGKKIQWQDHGPKRGIHITGGASMAWLEEENKSQIKYE